MAVASRQKIVSFGTFEVDLAAAEIRKSGLRVRLPGQPFRLLVALLARPGEVISREDLQHEIWGSNTNVDFERGIASAVNKLRDALGDSAEQPRYIETLARKGYRFIAPVSFGIELGSVETVTAGPQASSVPDGQAARAAFVEAPDFVHGASAPPFGMAAPGVQEPIFEKPPNVPPWLGIRSTLLSVCLAGTLVLLTASLVYQRLQPRNSSAPPRISQITRSNNIYPGPPNAETFLSIATDGPRLYVPVLMDGRSQLSSLPLNGAEPQPLNLPESLRSGAITAISQDGSKLLVRSLQTREPEQPLWVVPTTGTGILRVGDLLAHDATWMPGGEDTILFAAGNELGLARLGTGAVSTFASLPGRAFWLRWSPDGRTLRFTLLNPVNHTSTLWELDGATRRMHPLVLPGLNHLNICCGSWTPSGDAFVLQASDVHASNLWMVGTGRYPPLRQLTNGPIRFTSPMPGRESRSVFAFGVEQPGGTQIYDQALHQFVPAPHFLEDARRITYSRDGAWVAWTDPNGELWRARSQTGTDMLRLSGDGLEVFIAHWSPDGRQLLIMARQPGQTWQIYTISTDGGALHPMLNQEHNLADPDWSPDEEQIVFGREADLMGQESGSHDIQILDLQTHQVKSLPGSSDLFSPRWSPDGRWIAALSRDQARLLLYNIRDQSWTTLFTQGAADPVWGKDSHSIYFHAFAQQNSGIVRVTINGVVETVADLSRLGLSSAESYFFSGITPSGLPLIEPRVGAGNVYSVELP